MSLNPQVEELLAVMNSVEMPPLHTLSPQEVRAMMAAQPTGEEPEAVARVEEQEIPGDEGPIRVRIYWPQGEGPFPIMAFFHGGGFVICDLDTHDGQCRGLCNSSGLVVVSVDYRLAPEAKFPAALEDCYAATRWCAERAAELGARPDQLIVAGDSAGGCLAAAVTQMARDRGGPAIAQQVLIYPVTDTDFERESYLRNAEGYFLTRDMMKWFWEHYLPAGEDPERPYVAPIKAADLSNLPPAIVITAAYDPLHDEGRDYARALERAGVPVRYHCYDDMIHGFLGFPLETAHAAIGKIGVELKSALA